MASADANDRRNDIKQSYDSLFAKMKMDHEIFVDSRGIFGTNTTVHEEREYPLKENVL